MTRHLRSHRDSPTLADVADPRTPVHYERNLATLGFFTPSSKAIRKATEKTVVVTTVVDGRRVEASATILASPKYGLPTTADQDTYFAILKLATDQRRCASGRVENPISFSSSEILRLQGKADSGTNYAELQNQLMRLTATTVESRGAVFFANSKKYARDAFHLLERVVLIGSELEDGGIAEQNHVWLSQWQLQNLNANYFFSVDYDTYRLLRNPIAKALVPLLHVWLFASRAAGTFEKRYDELTDTLHVTRYQHVSKVKEKLGPALDELVHHNYLASWDVTWTVDRRYLKLVLHHGSRFAVPRDAQIVDDAPNASDEPVLQALTSRGISHRKAQQLLATRVPGQDVLRQLEYIDQQITSDPTKYRNPAGLYVRLIEGNVSVPESFLTSEQRARRDEDRQAATTQRESERRNRKAYDDYCLKVADDYFHALSPDARDQHIERAKIQIQKDHPRLRLTPEDLSAAAQLLVVKQFLDDRIPPRLSFNDFCNQQLSDG